MRPVVPPSLVGLALTLAALVGGCDHFDFGRVFGGPTVRAEQALPSAAPSAPVPDAKTAKPAKPRELVVVVGGSIRFEGAVKKQVQGGEYGALGGIEPLTGEASLGFAELSSRLFVSQRGKTPPYAAPVTAAAVLARGHLDAVALGGHAPRYASRSALAERTIEALRQANIAVAGVRNDSAAPVLTLEHDGRSVAIVSVMEPPAGRPGSGKASALPDSLAPASLPDLVEAIETAQNEHDVVLVTHHGNPERAAEVTEAQQKLARAALEAGADAVASYGPRRPLGVAWVDGRPVFYGLGNLVAEATSGEPWTGRGFIARLTFLPDGSRRVEACPYLIDRGVPELLQGASRDSQEGVFRRTLERLSDSAGGSRVGMPGARSCMRLEPPEH